MPNRKRETTRERESERECERVRVRKREGEGESEVHEIKLHKCLTLPGVLDLDCIKQLCK